MENTLNRASAESGDILLRHNLQPERFMWLWMKYVTAVNDEKHCTNCLRGKYGKILSKHNPNLAETKILTLNEQPLDSFTAIYVCGVIKKGYPKTNYAHNLHAVIRPSVKQTSSFEFEDWQLAVTNGIFERIPCQSELPKRYRGLPPEFTTCRIFRWAVCSDLNSPEQ